MSEIILPKATEQAPSRELLLPSTLKRIGRETVQRSGLIRVGQEPDQFELLHILDGEIATLINSHNQRRENWYVEDVLPIIQEGNVRRLLSPDESPAITSDVLAAALVGYGTEENLPGYYHVIADTSGHEASFATWSRQWAQEEGNHGDALRMFFLLTDAIPNRYVEDFRRAVMNQGYTIEKPPLHTFVYTSFQEKATQVAHRQTGLKSNNPYLNDILARIAKDETHHMVFYRELIKHAFDHAPNQTMQAVLEEVLDFEMPGAGIPGFQRRSLQIANADIYNLPRHLKEVVEPILRYWRVFERDDVTGYGAAARDQLSDFLDKLRSQAASFTDKRESGQLDRVIAAMVRRADTPY